MAGKKRKKTEVKIVKKDSKKLFDKTFKKETTDMPLFGIKIITLALLLVAIYSFAMIILYILSFFVTGPLRDYMLTGMFDKAYFTARYGLVKAENFMLLMGTFTSLISFLLLIWFSFGLYHRKNIARITISAVSIVVFIMSLFDLIFAGYTGSMQFIILVFSGIIPLYLLLNKNVRNAFL